MGEDESNGFFLCGIYLYGLEMAFLILLVFYWFYIEFIDLMIKGNLFNNVYEYLIYKFGYCYWGRFLGVSFDNDFKVFIFFGVYYFLNGNVLEWCIYRLDFNCDGINVVILGGSVYGDVNSEIEMVEIVYSIIILDFKIIVLV